jgi:RNA polymerase sigma factor (sigma-70 family)
MLAKYVVLCHYGANETVAIVQKGTVGELITRFDDGARAGQWHDADSFGGEIRSDQPGDEPGFFDETESETNSLEYAYRMGGAPQYNTEEEVVLAKKIEVGKFAAQLLETCDMTKERCDREEILELLRALYDAEQLPVVLYDELYGTPRRPGQTESFGAMMHRLAGAADEPLKRRMLKRVEREGIHARSQLIYSILPQVIGIVRQCSDGQQLPAAELVSYGSAGAVRAVDSFDYAAGNRLADSALIWIQNEIDAGIAATYTPESRMMSVDVLLERDKNGMADRHALAPDEEILGRVAPDDIRILMDAAQTSEDLRELFLSLDDSEAAVVRRVLGFDGSLVSFSEIALELGVSTEAVKDQYREALAKLRTFALVLLGRIAARLNIPIIPEPPESEPSHNKLNSRGL